MDECMYVWMNVWMNVCMYGWMNVWMNVCMYGWMNVWMNVCMYEDSPSLHKDDLDVKYKHVSFHDKKN